MHVIQLMQVMQVMQVMQAMQVMQVSLERIYESTFRLFCIAMEQTHIRQTYELINLFIKYVTEYNHFKYRSILIC